MESKLNWMMEKLVEFNNCHEERTLLKKDVAIAFFMILNRLNIFGSFFYLSSCVEDPLYCVKINCIPSDSLLHPLLSKDTVYRTKKSN
jgi:hypothetical protein